MRRKIGNIDRTMYQLTKPSAGMLTMSSQDNPASWWIAIAIPPMHMIGAVTSMVQVIWTSTCSC
ncbi:Uncharacterised protein [Mycobacteroides abscessus subsp. massiliense]|nr:Uncharacterised protein [Mycobacteroides abscessus subsp. massiliense]